MKELNKKANWALILSVASLVIIVAIIGLWCFKSKEIAVVTLDTFVGVIVALLAIIVTIAIGWQIFNIYEVKSQLNKIQQLKTELDKQRLDFEEMELSTAHLHAITLSHIGMARQEYCEAFHYLIEALYFSLQHPLMPNLESILLTIEDDCMANIKEGTIAKSEFYDKTILKNQQIRRLQSFSYIEKRYSKIYNDYMKKVCVDDDQK